LSLNGTKIVITDNGEVYINGNLELNNCLGEIAITPKKNKVILCDIIDNDSNQFLRLLDVSANTEIQCSIATKSIMSYDVRIYVKQEDILSEIEFIELNNKIMAVPRTITNVLENASKLFNGVVIQNVLGSCVASVMPRTRTCYQIRIPEMKGYQVIDAKYDKNVLIIIGNKKGKYDKFIFKLADDFLSYDYRKVEDMPYLGINFIVLDNGIVVHINEDEEIEIFSNKIGKNNVKIINGKDISIDMRLYSDGTKVIFSEKNKLYRIQMKSD
jgi:hypothetical protein